MDNMSERDLQRVRGRFVDLIKSFFVDSPDSEKLSRWRGTFIALKTEKINPKFDGAVRELAESLKSLTLDDLQQEYYELFLNPVGKNRVEMTASFHINGRSYDEMLVKIRGFMDKAGIHKDESVSHEPEDSLVIMLDSYGLLIDEETSRSDEAREMQGQLLAEFLIPGAEKISAALKENPEAHFYTLCGRFLCGYLELEKGLCW